MTNKKAFQKALETVKRHLPQTKNTAKPILLINNLICATDGSVAIETDVFKDLGCEVDFEKLYYLVKKLKGTSLEVTEQDGKLKLSTDIVDVTMPVACLNDKPFSLEVSKQTPIDEPLTITAKDLESMKELAKHRGNETDREIFQAICADKDTLVVTDGKTMMFKELETKTTATYILPLIPVAPCTIYNVSFNYRQYIVYKYSDSSFESFASLDNRFRYPNWRMVVTKDKEIAARLTIDAKTVLDYLSALDKYAIVSFAVKDTKVDLVSREKSLDATFKTKKPIAIARVEDTNNLISFSNEYLIKSLKSFKSKTFTVSYVTEFKGCLIEPTEAKAKEGVLVMPYNLNK